MSGENQGDQSFTNRKSSLVIRKSEQFVNHKSEIK
jgi:hypothetical protein